VSGHEKDIGYEDGRNEQYAFVSTTVTLDPTLCLYDKGVYMILCEALALGKPPLDWLVETMRNHPDYNPTSTKEALKSLRDRGYIGIGTDKSIEVLV